MKFYRPPKMKLYLFLLSMPLIDIVLNLILFKDRFWTDSSVWLVSFPLIFIMGMGSWYTHAVYENFIERKYPELVQSRQRILFKSLMAFLIMPPSILIILFIYNSFNIIGYVLHQPDIIKALLLGLSVNLIFGTLHEADYVLSKYREAKIEKETLRFLSVQDEFDTLKNQVNPHFLFNCFNTLSSLITVDKHLAEKFLNELSKVYRYLLRKNEEGLSTVNSEVQFIESYYRLLQTRHGEAVQLNIDIDKRYDSYLMPSLTLQLLVENAVKHNMLSRNKPLVIDIFTTAANKLVVNNNLQLRTAKVPSNQVGLDNIKSKYHLLNQEGFQVLADMRNFTVVLPLIWNNPIKIPGKYESINR